MTGTTVDELQKKVETSTKLLQMYDDVTKMTKTQWILIVLMCVDLTLTFVAPSVKAMYGSVLPMVVGGMYMLIAACRYVRKVAIEVLMDFGRR